jgi:N-acetylneuraminate synthase
MQQMQTELGVQHGYSDHRPALSAIDAVAWGTPSIVKHLFLEVSYLAPDLLASLEPAELTAMVSASPVKLNLPFQVQAL